MRRLGFALCALALPFAAAACGSDEPSGGDAAATPGTTVVSQDLAAVTAEVDALYAGTFGEPKESSPAAKGKSVYVLSCGQQVPTCSIPAAAAVEAGRKLGWKTTLIDGKFSPTDWPKGIETAVAAKADGIVLIAVDCQFVRPQLEKAKAAGVEVAALFAIDCDDESVGGEALFDAPMVVGDDPNWATQVAKYEADRAKVVVARQKGDAKVIIYDQDSLLITKYIRAAAEEELRTCDGCEIVERVPIALSDSPAVIQQKTQSALLKHPEANVLFPLHDGMTLSGVAAGLQASGRSDDVFLMGADAFPPSIQLIRDGVQDAQLGFPAGWGAYAAIDGLNRVFAGQQPQDSGIGWQLIDEQRNLPPRGGWEPPFDYVGAYEQLWNVG